MNFETGRLSEIGKKHSDPVSWSEIVFLSHAAGSGEIDGGDLLSCSSFVETQARRPCILQDGFLLVGP